MAEGVTTPETSQTRGPGLDKPIYTITIAAEILEVHPRTLMLYENVGLIRPQRTSSNRRRYSQRDIHRLQVVQELVHNHRVNLVGARLILTLLAELHRAGVQPPAEFSGIDIALIEGGS